MQILKLIFLPFVGLGLFTGMMILEARTDRFPRHPGAKDFTILATIHILIFGIGFLLASKSKPKAGSYRFGLSPGGWYVGFTLTYIAGLMIGYFMA